MSSLFGTPVDVRIATAGSIQAATSALVPGDPSSAGVRKLRHQQQEVLDERGRPLRFHGAFTGGFSAGYFNSVGSKEGWAPASFATSRSARAAAPQQSIASFMDDEDDALLGATLGAVDRFDTLGLAGRKRARDALEAEAASRAGPVQGGVAADLAGGALLNELVVSASDPVGRTLLQRCGWREGQPLGFRGKPRTVRRGGSSAPPRLKAAAVSAAQVNADELHMAALWKEGTARPAGARYGVGYTPDSLRDNADGTNERLAAATKRSKIDAERSSRRLQMSAALTGGSSIGGGGTRTVSAGAAGHGSAATRSLTGRLFATGDDGDDDDAAIYGQDSLRNYDIPSRRLALADRHAQDEAGQPDGAAGVFGVRRSGAAQESYAGSTRQPLALTDRAVLALEDKTALHLRCADGRPPLPGFHLSRSVERSFLETVRSHPPPQPPPGWNLLHTFTLQDIQDEQSAIAAFMMAHGAGVVQTPAAATTGSGSIPSSIAQQGASDRARAEALRLLAAAVPSLDDRFVSADAAATVAAVPPVGLSSTFLPSAVSAAEPPSSAASTRPVTSSDHTVGRSTIPAVGTRLKTTTTNWLPDRVLLKRFNVPDPFNKQDRASAEAAAARAGGSSGSGIHFDDQASFVPPAAFSAGNSAAAEPAAAPAEHAAVLSGTLAPLAAVQQPPASLFDAIFG